MVVSKKVASVLIISAVKLIVGWCLFHDEIFNDISAGVPEGDSVVDITFPGKWFVSAFVKDLFFDFPHENIGKGYSHPLVPMAVPCVCK